MNPTDDSDWLFPESEPDTEQQFASVHTRPSIIRSEAFEGPYSAFSTLIMALAEKPASPEAEVRGHGTLLAQATGPHEDQVKWVLTQTGLHVLNKEVNEVLSRTLADDFARAQ